MKLWALMLPLMLVLFIATLDQTIVASALGGIGRQLGDEGGAPWIATAYLLTSAVTTLIFGKLGDMKGRKPMFLVAIAIFTAGSALCALAPSMPWLIAFRGLQGVGGGGLSTLVMAIVGDLIAARQRAKYQAILHLLPAIAVVIGPLTGGIIVDHFGWPWIFLINLPAGVIAFCIIATRLKLPARLTPHRVDFAGGVLAIVFTTAFLLALVEGGHEYSWISWQIGGLATTAGLSLLGYLWNERRAAEPLVPLHLFRNSVFVIAAMLFFVGAAMLFLGMLFGPLMLQIVYGLSATGAGACLVLMLLGVAVTSIGSGIIISRTGRYKPFPILGAVLCGAGLLGLSNSDPAASFGFAVGWLAVLGTGCGLIIQIAMLAGQNAVPGQYLGIATGGLNFFKTLGGATGASVFGAVLADRLQIQADPSPALSMTAFHEVYWAAIPWTAVGLLLALAMKEKPLAGKLVGAS